MSTTETTTDTYRQPYTDDGARTLVIVSISIFLFAIVLTYVLSKFVDRYCSADIDYEAIIRRMEELNQGRPDKIPVLLRAMTEEERVKVLEKVLDVKPFSEELQAQLQLQREKAEENEKINQMETQQAEDATGASSNATPPTDEETPNPPQTSSKPTEDDENVDKNVDNKVHKNVAETVFKEFGSQTQKILLNNSPHQKFTESETCAICIEDYVIDQDVVIGANCTHVYHKDCILRWMKANHDFCPYCRTRLFPVMDFRKEAEEVLGEERFWEVVEQDDPNVAELYLDPEEREARGIGTDTSGDGNDSDGINGGSAGNRSVGNNHDGITGDRSDGNDSDGNNGGSTGNRSDGSYVHIEMSEVRARVGDGDDGGKGMGSKVPSDPVIALFHRDDYSLADSSSHVGCHGF